MWLISALEPKHAADQCFAKHLSLPDYFKPSIGIFVMYFQNLSAIVVGYKRPHKEKQLFKVWCSVVYA